MNSTEIITIILTSALISTLIAFLLRYIFESKQQHRFEIELQKLKHNYEIQLENIKGKIAINADIQHKITERKLESYPRLVELVYRTRNMARELASVGYNSTLAEEFQSRARELEDCLYTFRIDLERDGIFAPIHAYKNSLKNFNLVLREMEFFQSRDAEQEKIQETVQELQALYSEVEDAHKPIIGKLSVNSVISDSNKSHDKT